MSRPDLEETVAEDVGAVSSANVGDACRAAITLAGLRQAEAARRLGVDRSVVARLCSRAYTGHSMASLRALAEALELDVEITFRRRS